MYNTHDNSHHFKGTKSKAAYFEKVYLANLSKLVYFASNITGSSDSAQDLVQDVFTKMWENIEQYNEVHSIHTFLKRVVYNRCLDIIRHSEAENKYKSEILHSPTFLIEDVEKAMINKEIKDDYLRILSDMPIKRRTAFLLRQLDGLSLNEISNRMNISVKTVDCHLALARKILRLKLSGYYYVG